MTGSLDLYRAMLRIRLVEEEIAARYAEQEMRCPVHLSIGQEAVAAGVCAALRRDDQMVSTHRCHAHYLAKGGDLKAMLAEIYGKAAGCCGGRGGSMHLFDHDAGLLLSLPIVASGLPIAAGVALSFAQEGSARVAVGFCGDGSIEEGVFHETLNLAAVHRLPVLFVLENNLYSCYTGLGDRQPARPFTDLARGYAMPVETADGNDVHAVRAATGRAVGRARAGQGPTLLVFDTYRWREHCGPNYDNDAGYRTEAEFLDWKARCPLARLRAELVRDGALDEAAELAMLNAITAEIEEAFAFARAAPFPEADTVAEHVHA
ncbi:MAG TPA: thiamine pyrophosphate-dependent dehydrogenase E1 component subunit alpha [Azospirillum sp.]|nr:thiamine pyrophosphate-dependent dehydrogenase E1 component subunit alpha [Azospirillum sp.]